MGDFMAKPGVMFYFDTRRCLKRLSDEDKGRLFEAILDFGEFGVIPDFDGALGVAWDFIQPKIERDAEYYASVVEKRKKAADMRWEKERLNASNANEYKCTQDMPIATAETITSSHSKGKTIVVDMDFEKKTEEMRFQDLKKEQQDALMKHVNGKRLDYA